MNDSELAAGVRKGDRAAFERIFLEHYAQLCSFAAGYVRSKAAAEDVVSDVLTWVWTNRSAWSPYTGIKSFLYGAVRNRCLNLLRNESTSYRLTESPKTVESITPAQQPGADTVLDKAAIEAVVRSALLSLPERQRAIVTMRWGENGISWKEISAALGISPNAAEIEHRRALKSLKEKLPRWLL